MERYQILRNCRQMILVLFIAGITSLSCNFSNIIPIQESTSAVTPTPTNDAINLLNGKYSLQIAWEGKYSLPNGTITSTYGPDNVTIPLISKGNTYIGSQETVWHTSASGNCIATGTVPITFDITAKADSVNKLSFSVKRSLVWKWDTKCPMISGSTTSSNLSYTYVFDLQTIDGANKSFTQGGPIWIFTLKISN